MKTEQAWQELRSGIRAFVRRRVRNDADTDDVVQQVFLQVHRGIGSLRDEKRLHAWIYSAARNAIIDHYRSNGRRRDSATGMTMDLPDVIGLQVGEEGVLRELAQCLQPLMRRLPAGDSEALRLVDIDGWPQADAARQLGLSLSGMKSRVQRARLRLRGVVEACCRVEQNERGELVTFAQRGGACGPCGEGSGCSPMYPEASTSPISTSGGAGSL